MITSPYRPLTAEEELLKNALMGGIKVLSDVLSLRTRQRLAVPRRYRYVQNIVAKLQHNQRGKH